MKIRDKIVRGLTGLLIAGNLLGCPPNPSPNPNPNPNPTPINKAPETSIYNVKVNDETVTYNINGNDSDGNVEKILIRENDGMFEEYIPDVNGNVEINVPIIPGQENTLEAVAVDNKNLEDPTPAEYSFFADNPNLPPNTFIEEVTFDRGDVIYSIVGNDPDGFVSTISASENGNSFLDYSATSNRLDLAVPIVWGSNSLETYAVDNEGLEDSSNATYEFEVPQSSFNILKKIEDTFLEYINEGNLEGVYFDEDITIDNQTFRVDYIPFNKEGTVAIVNYTSFSDNLESEILNMDLLNETDNTNIYFFREPEFSVDEKLRKFLDSRFSP